ncbi:hypothetical protein BC629DRAFT_1507427 [Irpex lacteus]|nr:hypothetical protein BC629DRAFT_1507427 [Irpex lacteus]
MKKTYSIARNFTRLPAVRKSQPLTPRGNVENIQGPIIEYMEDMKRRRLYTVKRKTLTARLKIAEYIAQDLVSGHRSKKFILAAAISIPEVYDVLRPSSGDIDTGMNVDEIRRTLQELVPPFLESRDREIKEYFVQQTQWMSAEDIKLLVDAHLDLKWYHHPLPMDIVTDKGTKRTEMAIEACGFDPKCATAEELDDADVRIQCLACEPKETGIPIMNWRTAAQHRCYDAETPRFARATERQVAAAQSLWDAARNSSEEKWEKENAFSCAHCTEVSRKPLQDVKFHLFLRFVATSFLFL